MLLVTLQKAVISLDDAEFTHQTSDERVHRVDANAALFDLVRYAEQCHRTSHVGDEGFVVGQHERPHSVAVISTVRHLKKDDRLPNPAPAADHNLFVCQIVEPSFGQSGLDDTIHAPPVERRGLHSLK